MTAFYNETPQVFTANYRSLWSGLGSGNLSLSSLTPGGTTNAATTQTNIQNALAATNNSDLEVLRRKAGVRYDANLGNFWKYYASFTDEKRQGSRPFGAVFGGGGGGGNVEIPQSIDYDTRDFLVGVQFSDSKSSFNLRASASFFNNNIDTMTFQNPLFVTLNGDNRVVSVKAASTWRRTTSTTTSRASTRGRCPISTAATSMRPWRWGRCARTTT